MTDLAARLPVPQSIDLLWEQGQRRLDEQSQSLSRIDSKTTPLLAVGVAAFAFFRANSASLSESVATAGSALAALGVIAALGVMWPRTFSYAPEFRAFLADGNEEPDVLRTRYLGNIRTALRENTARLNIKVTWFKVAVGIYVAVVLIVAVSTMTWHG